MSTAIKTRIIKIGNSQGVRIPRLLLDQTNLSGNVTLEVEQNQIIIRPIRTIREGWDEQFKLMAQMGDDNLLDDETETSSWDDEEWEW